jgi:hypothetical protein
LSPSPSETPPKGFLKARLRPPKPPLPCAGKEERGLPLSLGEGWGEGQQRNLRTAAASILVVGGLVAMLVGGGAILASWYAGQTWAASDQAEQVHRQLAAETPQWDDDPSATAPRRPTPNSVARAATATTAPNASATLVALVPTPAVTTRLQGGQTPTSYDATSPAELAQAASTEAPATTDAPTEEVAAVTPTPKPRAPAEAIALVESDFRFLDPPEPGAQARISVEVRNTADLPTGPLHLAAPTRWFDGWKVVAADPPVLDDHEEPGKQRAFVFPSLDAHTDALFEIQLVATDDNVDPPDLRLALDNGDEIAKARPETVAPRPRPGPARTIEIPRLGLHTAVVPVVWEPPAWVVGQIRNTANLTEGNTVLVGHLTGLVGDVFADLSRLLPGDEIIATSRGLDYHFIVSETMILPNDNSLPMEPDDSPRLTLMTCSGEWNPITHDYSHRLWVVAEPLEQAERTLAGAPGPLTRQLGLAPPATIQAPPDLGPSPKEAAPVEAAATDAPVAPSVIIREPAANARVGRQVTVRGTRTDAADPSEPLWLAVRADVEGSLWYVYGQPLAVKPDGSWEASVELGGEAGVHQTIVVAPVDPATNRQLRQYVASHAGQPLPSLPPAFDGAAQITVERQ